MLQPFFATPLQKILGLIIALLAIVLVFGTAIVLVQRRDRLHATYRHSDPTPEAVVNLSAKKNENIAAYTGLGEIRALTRSPDEEHAGTVLVVTPWFSYSKDDNALFEELSQKNRQCRALVSDFFASYTRKELQVMGEQAVKDALLNAVNRELVLGAITAVYFNEYIFFE
ncbi:MAG: hypothetical protein J1D88_08120 [Treponema sp.]|nr:hypothetical protein [Treponema sp.]